MQHTADTCAIIVAAGSSRRMGFDKLGALLAGRPVLVHTLLAFEQCGDVASIVVVASRGREAWVADAAAEAGIRKLAQVVPGGAERRDSVRRGLEAEAARKCPLVAVHDAARPLIAPSDIRRAIDGARLAGAAACAHRIADTVKRGDTDDLVTESVDRTHLWGMETPQVFRRDLLVEATTAAAAAGLSVTDEVSAAQHLGHAIRLVASRFPNPKITVPSDLALCEALLAVRERAGPPCG